MTWVLLGLVFLLVVIERDSILAVLWGIALVIALVFETSWGALTVSLVLHPNVPNVISWGLNGFVAVCCGWVCFNLLRTLASPYGRRLLAHHLREAWNKP